MEHTINKHAFKLAKRCAKEHGKFKEFQKRFYCYKNTTETTISEDFVTQLYQIDIIFSDYIYERYYDTIKQEFVNFLQENNIFEEYFQNIDPDFFVGFAFFIKPFTAYKNKQDLLFKNLIRPSSFIYDVFKWEATKQGRNFWDKICFKWDKQLSNLLCKIINGTYNKK